MLEFLRERWMERAACADLPCDMFFPSDGSGVIKAQRVCARCPVTVPCLEYALKNKVDHGVWGGCSERKRRRILKARAAESAVMISETAVIVSQGETEIALLEERKKEPQIA